MLQEQESLLHRIGKTFRTEGEGIAHEPLPKRWVDLILYLDDQERKRAKGLEAKKMPRDRQ